MANNIRLQEQLNNAFIDIIQKNKNEEYARYLRSIQRDLIKNIDTLDADKIKEIVQSHKINIKDSVLLFSVLSAITTILNNKLTKKEKTAYAPIIGLMAIYSVKRPKVFVKRIYDITVSSKTNLTGNMLKSKELLNEYFVKNEASISNSIRKTENNIIRANRRRANTLTRAIRKDIDKFRNDNKSLKYIDRNIKEKYKVTDNVVSRNLDTELHAQAETVKVELAKGNGATHKTWKSQGDSRVRKTCFHNKVIGKRIPIDSDFRACGMKASTPGSEELPVGERIRCRCYLIFD